MTLQKTRTIGTPWAILLLALRPSRLVAHSVDHAVRSQPGVLTAEREQDLRRHFGNQFEEAVSLIRASLRKALLVVAFAVAAALFCAFMLHSFNIEKTNAANAWLQYGGIGVFLFATLGRAESAIETHDGGTLPERVDLWLYRVLYIVGSFGLALSVAW